MGTGAVQFLLEEPEVSQTVLGFLGEEVSPAGVTEHGEPWRCTVRTIIPKVTSSGSKLHKELIVKGESALGS